MQLILCSFFVWLFEIQILHAADDTPTAGEVMKDGNYLISSKNVFKLESFDLGKPIMRYLGIRIDNI